MQRNFRLVLSIVVVLLAGALAFGQEDKLEYKDVILDGKPAKLNVATGEITFVNPNDKKEPIKFDDFIAQSENETKSVIVTEKDPNFHVVKEGETLFEIATQYKTSLTELKKANNLETTLVSKGQRLRVKNFDSLDYEVINNPSTPITRNSENNFHIVEEGETLYGLAKRYGLTVDELKRSNNLTSNIILIGQKLKIDGSIGIGASNDSSIWIVSKGDTLYSIAKKNSTTVEALKLLNGLADNLIVIGQKLKLK